jgi:hypothetical protein
MITCATILMLSAKPGAYNPNAILTGKNEFQMYT